MKIQRYSRGAPAGTGLAGRGRDLRQAKSDWRESIKNKG